MIAFVEVEVAREEEEPDEAEGSIEAEGPEEKWMGDRSGDVRGINDSGEKGDG